MPNTRASTRKQVSKKRLSRREHSATSDNESIRRTRDDAEEGSEAGMSIMHHLSQVRSGVEELNTRIRSLEQENRCLKSELQVQRTVHNDARGGNSGSREKGSRRRIQSLERTIADLKAARERDRGIIEQLREKEVQRDAEELADDHDGDTIQETEDPSETAVKLLRRVCDVIDMNTLAEGEECAICMEEMEVEKCYSLPCQHPVCAECFQKLGNGPSMTLNHQTGSVQCPHCREPCQRDECEIITHTAEQQWDLLLEISRQWAAIDVGEIGTGEEEEEKSFIDDGSVAATESPLVPETLEEGEDPDPEISTASPSLNDTGPVTYKSLPSPLKRKRLEELAEQRAVKQRG